MTDEDSRREKIQEEFIRYILEQELKKQNNPDYFIEQFGKMKIRRFRASQILTAEYHNLKQYKETLTI